MIDNANMGWNMGVA